MKKQPISKWIIIPVILGIFVIGGVHIYMNTTSKSFQKTAPYLDRGRFNPNDLQPYSDLRSNAMSINILKRINYNNKENVLLTCSFDTKTPWPEGDRMAANFNPMEVINQGMDPGLGIRNLHQQGITGKGVKVALLDFAALRDHEEFKSKIALSLLSDGTKPNPRIKPAMHSNGTAGLLVGEKCGTAPGATLYFWGEADCKNDFIDKIESIDQVLQFNKNKSRDEKIRIISTSIGISEGIKNHKQFAEKIEEAQASGVTVVYVYNGLMGTGCPIGKDRDDPKNYQLWSYFEHREDELTDDYLLVPCDFRTTSSDVGDNDYVYFGEGGVSWSVPYLAGVIALGYQVNPDLTTEDAFKYINETATPMKKGKLINPVGFIEKVKAMKGNQKE